MTLKIIQILKMPRYIGVAVISAIIFAFLYIYSQVLGIVENIDLWITYIPLQNAILFIIMTVLFGITMSFQVYNLRQPKVCHVKKGTTVSGAASAAGFFIAQCPACASLSALFLPASAILFLTQFSVAINMIIIFVLLFTIRYLGGFKNIGEK